MENGKQSEHLTQPRQRVGSHAERFAAQIEAEGYGPGSIAQYRVTAKALWSAMEAASLNSADLTDDRMNQLVIPVISVASAKDQKHCRYRLNRFRDYLIENADAPARSVPSLDMSPRACLKREYETYLNVQRGLSQDTIYHCLR